MLRIYQCLINTFTNKIYNNNTNSNTNSTNNLYWIIYGLMSRVFVNGPGDQGSIAGRVIPKTQEIVLDTSLLNTQHYNVRIKGKVEQSREWISTLPYISV